MKCFNCDFSGLLHRRIPSGPAPPCPESTPLPPQVVGQVTKIFIYSYNVFTV